MKLTAIIGHKPDEIGGYQVPNPTYNAVMDNLRRAFVEQNVEFLVTGMDLGVPQWAAQLAVSMNIPFGAVIAFEGFESRWPPRSQAMYKMLLSRAAQTVLVSPGTFSGQKMQLRNQYVMDICSDVIAVWNGDATTNTGYFVGFAQQCGKPVHFVPTELAVPPPIAPIIRELAAQQQEPRPFQIRIGESANAKFGRKIDLDEGE